MSTEGTSDEKAKSTVTGFIRHMLGLAFAITLGVADASEPAPGAVQRSLQNSAWVLYQVKDVHGNAIAPFAQDADGNSAIVPVLFRSDYMELATACGRQVAPYRKQGKHLIIAQAYVSHHACKADAVFARSIARLRGEFIISFQSIAGTDEQALRLKASSGDEFLFYNNGQLRFTDADDVLPQPLVLYLQIGPETMGCGYNGPIIPGRSENVCMVARPVKQAADGKWRASSAPSPVMPGIRGFEPPPGSRTIVRILRYKLANPDIHASPYRDVLDMVIEQHLSKTPPTDYQNPSHHWIP